MWDLGKGSKNSERSAAFNNDQFVQSPRQCRDIVWTILFLLCSTICLVIFFFSLHYGSPSLLPPATTHEYENKVSSWFTDEVAILYHDLPSIALALSASLVLAFCWIQLLKSSTRLIIVGTILALAIASIGFGLYCWNLSYRLHSTFFMLLAWMCWIVALCILVLSYAVRAKISFTADVMRECGHVIQNIPLLVVIPFVFGVIYIVSVPVWILSLIYLSSVPSTGILEGSESILYVTFFEDSYRWLIWIMLFGGFWWFSLLSAFEQYIVARIVYAYQESTHLHIEFSSRKMLGIAIRESLFYALGSLAFGAIISALAELLSWFIKYSGVSKRITLPQFCCSEVCISLAQSVIQWTNGFTYIYIATHGYSFSMATGATFELLRTNFSRVALASLMVNYLLSMGTLFFTFAVAGVTIATIESYHYHIGLISILVTAFSVYLLFHLIGRLILIVVNTVLIYLFENKRSSTTSRVPESLLRLIQVEVDKETGNAVHI